jgi:hypothetical protein
MLSTDSALETAPQQSDSDVEATEAEILAALEATRTSKNPRHTPERLIMSQVIIEKLDAMDVKQSESIAAVEAKIPAAIEAVKAEMGEMIAALEAKVASVQAPTIIKAPAKTVRQDVNRSVREQLSTFYKGNNRVEKELQDVC